MKWITEPTEPGTYLLNNGDVVTDASIRFDSFRIGIDGRLVDSEGIPASAYAKGWKFIKLDLEQLNAI